MDFEKTKKEFIVDATAYTREKLTSIMQTLLEYAKVGTDGEVMITRKLSTRKILKLILVARYVAREVDEKISGNVTKKELENYSGLKKNVFRVRYNELTREGFAEKKGDALKVRNVLLIEKFMEELKRKNGRSK